MSRESTSSNSRTEQNREIAKNISYGFGMKSVYGLADIRESYEFVFYVLDLQFTIETIHCGIHVCGIVSLNIFFLGIIALLVPYFLINFNFNSSDICLTTSNIQFVYWSLYIGNLLNLNYF